jgi:hypothetical protein
MRFLTSEWLRRWINALDAARYRHAAAFLLPHSSARDQGIYALSIGTGPADGRAALLIGGVHGDELVPPQMLLSFAVALSVAYASRRPMIFGARTYPYAVVAALVESLRIYIVPVVNPDGRDYVLSLGGDPTWRRNRPRAAPGVDINRNYDFLWAEVIGDTSSSPDAGTYCGPAVFSEPETRNVRSLLDDHPEIGLFVDIHSRNRGVFYPWGNDTAQTTNPAMSFNNPAYSSHGGAKFDAYDEYMPPDDLARYRRTAARIADGMESHRRRPVRRGALADLLYRQSGDGADYAYSRHFVNTALPRMLSFTIELAHDPQPLDDAELEAQVIEGSIGLTEALLDYLCPAETMGRMSGMAGDALRDKMRALRQFRAEVLAPDERGQHLARLFDAHRGELTRLLLGQSEAAAACRPSFAAGMAAAETMLRREPVMLDPEALAAFGAAVAVLEEAGSPALRTALGELRAYVLRGDAADVVTPPPEDPS